MEGIFRCHEPRRADSEDDHLCSLQGGKYRGNKRPRRDIFPSTGPTNGIDLQNYLYGLSGQVNSNRAFYVCGFCFCHKASIRIYQEAREKGIKGIEKPNAFDCVGLFSFVAEMPERFLALVDVSARTELLL